MASLSSSHSPSNPYAVAAEVTAGYLGTKETNLTYKKDLVEYSMSPLALRVTFPPPLPHHSAAQLIGDYLGSKDVDLPLKMDLASVIFTTADGGVRKGHPIVPDRYSFRLARVCRFLESYVPKDRYDEKLKEKALRWLFCNETLPLFRNIKGYDFTKREIRALLTGKVFNDGIGDYVHIHWGAENTAIKFPKAKVTLGLEVGNLAARREKFSMCEFPRYLWNETGEQATQGDVEALVEQGKKEKCPRKRLEITASIARQLYDAEKATIKFFARSIDFRSSI